MNPDAENRDFFYLLHRHYPLIRTMCQRPTAFDNKSEVINFISDYSDSKVQAASLFERFLRAGIIARNHSFWVTPSYLSSFVRKREGILSFTSSNTVRSFVKDLDTHLYSLKQLATPEGVWVENTDGIIDLLRDIEDTYTQLATASQNNCSKISNEVEQFQLHDDDIVLHSKIQRFHHLYDRYIEPMLGIIVDPNSELANMSADIQVLCESLSVKFSRLNPTVTASAESLKRTCRLHSLLIADRIRQAKNELDIIFEVYTAHARIINGVNHFWQLLDQGGPSDEFWKASMVTATRLRYSNPSNQAYGLYFSKMFAPQKRKRPRVHIDADREKAFPAELERPTFADIRDRLHAHKKGVPCLLGWLSSEVPQLTASEMVEMLFELEDSLGDQVAVTDREECYEINGLKFKLKPRQWAGHAGN